MQPAAPLSCVASLAADRIGLSFAPIVEMGLPDAFFVSYCEGVIESAAFHVNVSRSVFDAPDAIQCVATGEPQFAVVSLLCLPTARGWPL